MFLLLCNWSEVYHLNYRLAEKDIKWQATYSCRSNSIGYKINLSLLKHHFTVTLRDFKIHFEIKFYFVAIWFIRHFMFFMSWGILASPRKKPSRSSLKIKFEDCLANITSRKQNYFEISKLLFKCEVMQLFLTGFSVNYCLWEIFAIKNFWRVTSLSFFSRKV